MVLRVWLCLFVHVIASKRSHPLPTTTLHIITLYPCEKGEEAMGLEWYLRNTSNCIVRVCLLPECLATIQNVLNIIIMQFNTKMLYYLSPSSSSASLSITSVVYSDSCLVNLALWRLFFFVIYIVDEIFYQSVCLTKVTINSDECKTNYYCSSKTL